MDPATSRGPFGDARLATLRDCANELAEESLAGEIDEFASRLGGGRFYVACLGQFKRGKSSLLNALLGRTVLPVGVLPVTSVVTIVRFGDEDGIRIHFRAGPALDAPLGELARFVSEEANPDNDQGVVAAEVFVPSRLLRSGLCLVDTPGLGSVFAHNTATTRAFLPQIDAALLCVGADPPLSSDELDLAANLAPEVDALLVVMSKADRFSRGDLDQAKTFAQRTIERRVGRAVHRVFELSATERLSGAGPERDWPALVSALAELSGADLLQAARSRGVRRFAGGLCRAIEERRAALTQPLEVSAKRVRELRDASARARRSIGDLRPLLDVEERRLQGEFRRHLRYALAHVVSSAERRLADELDSQERSAGSRAERLERAYGLARDVARSVLEGWRKEEEAEARRLYENAMHRFVDQTRASLAEVLTASERQPGEGETLLLERAQRWRAPSHLFFTDALSRTARTPLGWLGDALRPRATFARVIARRARAYLIVLLDTNANRLVNDLIEQVRESRSALEHDVVGLLRELCGSAERALARAEEVRASGAARVRDELHALDAIERRVAAAASRDEQHESARERDRHGSRAPDGT